MPTVPTSTRYVVQSIFPVAGWQAVYWDPPEHVTYPAPCLAHVHQQTYNVQTGRQVPDWLPEKLLWDISAVLYSPADGWNLCLEDANFCGLLAPGATLAEFLTAHACHGQAPPSDAERC